MNGAAAVARPRAHMISIVRVAAMSSNWRPLNGDEKIQAVKDWLKKRWSDDYKAGREQEDQTVDYYFYLGRKSTAEDLEHYIEFILEKSAYVELPDEQPKELKQP
jgi:hypothetical protein